jgi:hypothetical protein|tara:strand:+ start:57 stop:1004 length:948 start_codon:yes stop_codon:yes gene_type:complete
MLSSTFPNTAYFQVKKKNGVSPAEMMGGYLGGSAFQTVIDNPVTAYRQLIQQFAKGDKGEMVDPKVARQQANTVFKNNPLGASLSGIGPRLIGVGFKRIPKFGFLLGIAYATGNDGKPDLIAATGASILSAPFINPIRMIEKQQRAEFKTTGVTKPILEIVKEAGAKNFRPLFRGTLPLMGHSLASATTGLVGQPQLQAWINGKINEGNLGIGQFAANMISSALVSPIYILMTNPLSRLEVIMQTNSMKGKSITLREAIATVVQDSKEFGLRGVFRGQGIGIAKAIVSLSMFHQGRIWCTEWFRERNEKLGRIPL